MTPLPLGLRPDPPTAHHWLAEELSRSAYQESLVERVLHWLSRLFDRLAQETSGGGSIPTWPAILVLVVLVVVIAIALSRLQPRRSGPAATHEIFADQRLTSQEHRSLAQAAVERRDWETAVVEGFRTLAAGLIERGLVRDAPDLTTQEIADTATARFPELASATKEACRAFDETRYGGREATPEQARQMLALEQDLARSPAQDSTRRGPSMAVPR